MSFKMSVCMSKLRFHHIHIDIAKVSFGLVNPLYLIEIALSADLLAI